MPKYIKNHSSYYENLLDYFVWSLSSLLSLYRCFDNFTFFTFGEAQIFSGIVSNLTAFGLFLGSIGYVTLTGKSAVMSFELQIIRKYVWILLMVTSFKKESSSSKSNDYLKTSDRKRPTWHFEVEGSGQRKRYLKSLNK